MDDSKRQPPADPTAAETTRVMSDLTATLHNAVLYLAQLIEKRAGGATVDEDGDEIDSLVAGACGVIMTSFLQIGMALEETNIKEVGSNWIMQQQMPLEEMGIRKPRSKEYH